MVQDAYVYRIPLYGRGGIIKGYTLVDAQDYEWLSRWRWNLVQGYAARRNDKSTVYMHREILGLGRGNGLECDHINGDRLDNRRVNIRIVTHAQNQQNMRSYRTSASGIRGIYWHRRDRKWKAKAQLYGRVYHVGSFESKEEAAAAITAWRKEYMPFSGEERRL